MKSKALAILKRMRCPKEARLTVKAVLQGTKLHQRALAAYRSNALELKVFRRGDRYLVHGNQRLLGELPSPAARAFALAEDNGCKVRFVAAAVMEVPGSLADPRDAAFSVFDWDDEDKQKPALGMMVMFEVDSRPLLVE